MVGGRSEARITNLSRGSIRVQHREFIKNIGATEDFTNLGTFPLQPGDSSTFPWLAQIAQNYERWHPNRIDFKYEPFTSTFTPGTASLMIDYDPNDAGPINKAEMLNSSGAMRTPVWSDVTVRSNDSELAADTHLFVRVPTRGVFSGNLRLTDSGTCFVATTEVPANTGDVGEIWVDYDITFHVPALNKSEALSSEAIGDASDGRLLGEISSKTAEPGSSTSFKTGVSSGEAGVESILEFTQDFTGTVHVECNEDSAGITPAYMSADTDGLDGASPALIGYADNAKDFSTFGQGKSILSLGVVAKAGDALRIIADEATNGWSLGKTVVRLFPYAKALMGLLATVVLLEEKVVMSIKTNKKSWVKIPDDKLILLGKQIALLLSAPDPTPGVMALINTADYDVPKLTASLTALKLREAL